MTQIPSVSSKSKRMENEKRKNYNNIMYSGYLLEMDS